MRTFTATIATSTSFSFPVEGKIHCWYLYWFYPPIPDYFRFKYFYVCLFFSPIHLFCTWALCLCTCTVATTEIPRWRRNKDWGRCMAGSGTESPDAEWPDKSLSSVKDMKAHLEFAKEITLKGLSNWILWSDKPDFPASIWSISFGGSLAPLITCPTMEAA